MTIWPRRAEARRATKPAATFETCAERPDVVIRHQTPDGLKLELAYFSGHAWLKRRGAGAILRFERVRPRHAGRFQPLLSSEITPGFLDRTIRALKRWKYDIVSIDEVCRRAVTLASRRRFVCLTFDGTYKDVITSAYPVLARHRVPFTVYVPTAFPDGIGEAWWLALEQVIAKERRISLVMGRRRCTSTCRRRRKNINSTIFCRAGCVRLSRRTCPPPSRISARVTPSILRRCRGRLRSTGATLRPWRPIRW